MATYSEQLQGLWHRYNKEHGDMPAAPRSVVTWALENHLLESPRLDEVGMLAIDLARALREEYKTDVSGRRYRVNHAVRITKNGIQMSLWAELTSAPRNHMLKAFGQRRKQIVGDCVQLKVDVDVFNDNHKTDAPIQMIFDFTDDVKEAEIASGRTDDEDAA